MTDILELFQRDPLSLTRDDLTAIIEKFRSTRHQFNLGNAKAGSTKPKTEKEKKTEALAQSLGAKFTLDL